MRILIISTLFFLLTSCKEKIPFDKVGWIVKDDLGLYPNREKMVDNLTKNQKLKGLTYRQLIKKIGEPDKISTSSNNTIYYNIVTNYGYDIDPVISKSLEFRFDKDSVITAFKINEIKH
ncbi:MAG: hypothetical protein ACRCVT_01465 [Leadbetterella sp.]